ncbi:hypothetical protein WA026_010163 [Henosepilachna vigintioctopunctata]|uniref:Rhodanese domain-containing protein n=1 Tax=Henosepilachna vigintioctopunctata TaxID=420089 RepID=A0AAW1UGT0_9CUCU
MLSASFNRLVRLQNRVMSTLVSTFQDVRSAKSKNILVIDVREPQELQETGQIEGSVNIPVDVLEQVFSNFSTEKFKSVYGENKPDFDTPMIVSCRSGKRSLLSQDILKKLGYKNVSNYSGGWLDWEKNINQN